MKIFCYWSDKNDSIFIDNINNVLGKLEALLGNSNDLQVQHTVYITINLLKCFVFEEPQSKTKTLLEDLRNIFAANPIIPVSQNAQKRVKVPENLDLDSWIFEIEDEKLTKLNEDDDDQSSFVSLIVYH